MTTSNIMKRLWTFVGKSKVLLLLSFTCAIVSVLLNLIAPLIIGNTIDSITYTNDITSALQNIFILGIMYILYSLFHWGMMYTSNRIAFSSSCALRKMLYDKLDRLPISFFDQHSRGDLISRFINDIDYISDGLLQSLSTLISGVVTIVMSIVFMLSINVYMSFVVILSAPFTYVVAKTITKRTQKYFRKQATTLGKLNGYGEEILSQVKTVKAYHFEKSAHQEFKNINQDLYHSGVKSQFYGSLANPSTRFVMNIAYALVGMAGAVLALYQMISIGNISTFLIYSNVFSKPFNEITAVITQLQSAIASARRIFVLMDETEEQSSPKNTLTKAKGKVDFQHVFFSYTKDKPLIKDFTIHIPEGSKVAIVGRTGAGKTTLVNLLMRFYDIQKGSITIDDQDIYKITRDSLRHNFGMVLQDTYLFEDSIAANLAYGKEEATREEIIEASKKTGAHEFIKQLNQGYDTILHANSSSLSQGQRQLLTITRVLLMNPSILILDEATSNIDTRSEQHVSHAMNILMKQKTSFVIAHRLSTILQSDIILAMDHGDIIEQGTHEQLLANKGYYYQLYQSQFS